MAKVQLSISLEIADIGILDDVARLNNCKNRTEAVELIIHQWKSFLESVTKANQQKFEEAKQKHKGKRLINPLVNP